MTLGRETERKGEDSLHIFQINNKGEIIVSPTRCMFRFYGRIDANVDDFTGLIHVKDVQE